MFYEKNKNQETINWFNTLTERILNPVLKFLPTSNRYLKREEKIPCFTPEGKNKQAEAQFMYKEI